MSRTVYVVSDVHLGPGRDVHTGQWDALEDFTADEAFCAFLDQIGQSRAPIELVIAGDFLEYPQTLPEIGLRSPADYLGTTEQESVERTRVILGQCPDIASGHPAIFAALRRFMAMDHSITIIAGNHDIDLLWKEVWALVFDTIYPPGSAGDLRRHNFSHTIGAAATGRVYIEHGHEHDKANRFGDEMQQPFDYDNRGVQRLKRCWGTLFVDKVYNQLEYDRWFIDNVKPILRVVKLGLRHDFAFTATAVGLVTRFLLTSGLPPVLGASNETLGNSGETAPNTATIVDNVKDDALRRYVQRQMDDPAFRSEFEQTMHGMTTTEWAMVQAGSAPQMTLDEASGTVSDDVVLGGLFGGEVEEAYRQAARAVLASDPQIATVVMGHTHVPIDGLVDPVYLPDQRTGYYFNSGTWTPHLRDEAQHEYSWAEIGEANNYAATFTYLQLEPNEDGVYRVTLRSWQEDEG